MFKSQIKTLGTAIDSLLNVYFYFFLMPISQHPPGEKSHSRQLQRYVQDVGSGRPSVFQVHGPWGREHYYKLFGRFSVQICWSKWGKEKSDSVVKQHRANTDLLQHMYITPVCFLPGKC